MIDVLIGILQLFDLHFLRLVFNLIIDYLITAGYLLPEQRAVWEQGYINIIGVVSAAVFMAIWQYKAKHPHTEKVEKTTKVITPSGTSEYQSISGKYQSEETLP